MDNLNYNASHAPDPTARDAITAADEMPARAHDAPGAPRWEKQII